LSEDEDELVSASDIKQFHFCPRIIYFTKILGVYERTTESEDEGKRFHKKFYENEKRRMTLFGSKSMKVEKKWINYFIKSERLGLKGTIDMIVKIKDELIVVEFKEIESPKKVLDGHIYQAAAYALLVEEKFDTTIRRIILYYSKNNKIIEIPLTDNIRNHILWTIKKIRKIILKEYLPMIRPSSKCYSCGYNWICHEA
jgi:CRISPR-associated exonuclease Cas4